MCIILQLTEAQTQTESEGPVVARPLHRVMERKVELLMLQSLPRLLDRAACEATSLLRDEQLGSVCNATFATLVYVGAKLQVSGWCITSCHTGNAVHGPVKLSQCCWRDCF